jgi:hypothetical protein
MKYDADGNLVEWRAVDLPNPGAGRPGTEIPALIRLEYDGRGFLVRRSFFDAQGKPWAIAAAMTYRNDDRGRPIEQKYVPSKDAPPGGVATATQRMKYDEEGNVIERWTVGGHPARTKMRYDARGNVTQEAYFDKEKPTTVAGYHRVTAAYNDRGRMTERAFFGTSGQPAQELRPAGRPPSREEVRGPARWTWRWDELGNLEEIAAFGPDGKRFDLPGAPGPFERPGFPGLPGGVARATLRHDDRGNVTELAFFDARGRSVAPQGEVPAARVKLAYDEHGNRTEVVHLDPAGQLVRQGPSGRPGYLPRTTAAYDDDGRMVAWAGFDADNQPAAAYQGAARLAWSFDGHGRLTSVVFQGGDEKPVLSQLGYARASYTYDERGQLVQSSYLDLEGNPVSTRLVVSPAGIGPRGGPPPQYGLRPGDVLLRYGGQPVRCAHKLRALVLADSGSGKQAEVQVLRDGRRLTFTIWPPPAGAPFGPGRSFAGGLLPRPDQLPTVAGIETVAVEAP